MENKILLRLIRHGLSQGNKDKVYTGQTDSPLSDEGRKGLEELYGREDSPEKLALRSVTGEGKYVLFSSPLSRCIQTAQVILPDRKPVIIEELKEMDFGIFEGKSYSELENMKEYRDFIASEGAIAPPGGESRAELRDRVLRGIKKCRQYLCERDSQRGVVFMHGGTIMSLFFHITGSGFYEHLLGNGCGCTLEISGESMRIIG